MAERKREIFSYFQKNRLPLRVPRAAHLLVASQPLCSGRKSFRLVAHCKFARHRFARRRAEQRIEFRRDAPHTQKIDWETGSSAASKIYYLVKFCVQTVHSEWSNALRCAFSFQWFQWQSLFAHALIQAANAGLTTVLVFVLYIRGSARHLQ